jgi:8-oxo-dGTP pyrophosphatase MutT (NUDIX family)
MSDADRSPAEPRLAATLLVVRDTPFEVLMVRRSDHGSFASALVFPGGCVEEEDYSDDWLAHIDGAKGLDRVERALRIAGIRETFEETAVLLATDAAGLCPPLGDVGGLGFLDLVRRHGLRLRLDGVVPFAHWITPEFSPKRFDTHFYVVRAPQGSEATCDGIETVALEWANPHDVLARAQAGERSILFPTRLNLARLAESKDGDGALAAAALRPAFTVLPQRKMREDGVIVTIPAEAGYTETEHFHPKT